MPRKQTTELNPFPSSPKNTLRSYSPERLSPGLVDHPDGSESDAVALTKAGPTCITAFPRFKSPPFRMRKDIPRGRDVGGSSSSRLGLLALYHQRKPIIAMHGWHNPCSNPKLAKGECLTATL
jgi:hypothetical protein